MSASKKKMQRREAEKTEKVTQAQAEQAAYKKKARLYTVIGIIVVVLVAALLIWNSGIFQKNATAATIGDTKLSAAELSYYYYNSDIRYIYSYYGLLDTSVNDDKQYYDETTGTTYQDYFLEAALADAQSTQVMYEKALASGYSDADVADSVRSQIDSVKATATSYGYSYKSFLKTYYGRYMTPSAFEEMITRSLLASLYSNDVYAEQYDAYTAADLDAYYAADPDKVDTITYSYLYFGAETVETFDEEGNILSDEEIAALEEQAMADALVRAELAQGSYKNGTEVADVIENFEPDTSLDYNTVVGTGSISSTYSEELLALNAGDSTIVEHEGYGYYLVILHERSRDESLTANVRHILFNADTTTDADGNIVAPTDEAWAAALNSAEAALAEYKAGEQTAAAFGALAEKYSSDTGSNTNGGLYEGVAEGDFVTEFNDWMFGEVQPAPGDTAVIRHEGDTSSTSSYWGYHVTYLESWGEAEWQVYVRELMTEEAMTELQDSLNEASPAALASGSKHVGT